MCYDPEKRKYNDTEEKLKEPFIHFQHQILEEDSSEFGPEDILLSDRSSSSEHERRVSLPRNAKGGFTII